MRFVSVASVVHGLDSSPTLYTLDLKALTSDFLPKVRCDVQELDHGATFEGCQNLQVPTNSCLSCFS